MVKFDFGVQVSIQFQKQLCMFDDGRPELTADGLIHDASAQTANDNEQLLKAVNIFSHVVD